MTDKNEISEKEQQEIIDLMKLLEPELKELDNIILEMAKIDTPFQNEFNHLRMMINMNKINRSDSKSVSKALILIKEINGFARLLDRLSESPDERDLYVERGLFEKCEDIRDRFVAKVSTLK